MVAGFPSYESASFPGLQKDLNFMRVRGITRVDILTVIEEVGFGKCVIAGADERGVVVNG